MSFLNRIISYLKSPRNFRQVILIAVGLIVLGTAVLFSAEIEKLLNRPGASRASGIPPESILAWQQLDPGLSHARSGAQLIEVNQSGSRYLYAIGGIEYSVTGGALRLIDTVERKRLSDTGELETGAWERVREMKSGHADFKAFQYNNYLYVVAGDIHMPNPNDSAIYNPLPFSTIERLDLNDPNSGWEVMAKLGGVNFFPEVTVKNGRLHIVGGVYGIPYSAGRTNQYGNYTLKEPILGLTDEINQWDSLYKNIPTTIGTPGVSLIPGTVGDNIVAGGLGSVVTDPIVTTGTITFGAGSNGVQIQQMIGPPAQVKITPDPVETNSGQLKKLTVSLQDSNGWGYAFPPDATVTWTVLDSRAGLFVPPPAGQSQLVNEKWFKAGPHPGAFADAVKVTVVRAGLGSFEDKADVHIDSNFIDYAATLSKSLLNGQFATTVSEHYVIDLGDTLSPVSTGELGVGYRSNGDVVTTDYVGDPISNNWESLKVGRIGHLRFYVTDQSTITPVPQGRYGFGLIYRANEIIVVGGASWFNSAGQTFWVIDDDLAPYRLLKFGVGSRFQYAYVGNVAYRWLDDYTSLWQGTNSNEVISYPLLGPASEELADTYAFKDGGVVKGRAFFGMAELEVSAGVLEWLTVGGLINDSIVINPNGSGYANLRATARTELFSTNGWEGRPNLYNISDDNTTTLIPYGVNVGGAGNAAVAFGGQRYSDTDNFHIPDYQASADNRVWMLIGDDQWYKMTSLGEVGEDGSDSIGDLIFSSVQVINTGAIGEPHTVYIYQAGGATSTTNNDTPFINSTATQMIGPFTYGAAGTVYSGDLDVSPLQLAGDSQAYAVATVALRDYFDQPVVGAHIQLNISAWSMPDSGEFTPGSVEGLYGGGEGNRGDPDPEFEGKAEAGTVLKTGADGIVRFKIISAGPDYIGGASIEATQVKIVDVEGVPTLTTVPPVFGPVVAQFVRPNVPWNTWSTIQAEPSNIVPNGTDISTITVTLKDGQDSPKDGQDSPAPVAGYKVRVISDRNNVGENDYSGNTDLITAVDDTTNADGQATFKIASARSGDARLWAEYQIVSGDDIEPDGYWVRLTAETTVRFSGIITNISPSSGRQGQNISAINLTGAQTGWHPDPDGTTVEFIQPADINFYVPSADGDLSLDNNLNLIADGNSHRLVVQVPGAEYASRSVRLTIQTGGGELSVGDGNYDTTVVVQLTAGRAEFEYRCPQKTPGILKLNARITTGLNPPDYTLWRVIQQASNPYQMEIVVDPGSVAPNGESAIKARIYRMFNGAKAYVTSPLEFSFSNDDGGHITPDTDTSDANGIVNSIYVADTVSGSAGIFVSAQFGSFYVAGQAKIIKSGSGMADADMVKFSTQDIQSSTRIVLTGIQIGVNAKVGPWVVRVTTPDSTTADWVEEGIFTVMAADTPIGGPTITIEPRSGLRGSTMELDVTGYGTSFVDLGLGQRTELSFTPPTGGSALANGIAVDNITVHSQTSATVTITIAANATTGFWEVAAITGYEIAEMTGATDFVVTDEHNYILNIQSNAPNDTLPRDGRSQTTITASLGKLDPLDGSIVWVPNVEVELTKGADAGTLSPRHPLSGKTIITTNDDGSSTPATYRTDKGEVGEFVTITATAVPTPGTTISTFLQILKSVGSVDSFTVSANPDQLSLSGDPHIATLSFAGLDDYPAALVNFVVKGNPKGHIVGSPTRTTAQYVADIERIPEVVEFYARANLPGLGAVRSKNIGFISVGIDQAKYRIESLTATPSSVVAGGTQTSTIVARLLYNQPVGGWTPVDNWPISFELSGGAFGDYISPLQANTVSGNATTVFAPGPMAGNVQIIARPQGLRLAKDVQIVKTAIQIVDLNQSAIWGMPSQVPISADGSKYSLVTVMLKNANGTPLSNKSVKLSSSRTQDVIKLSDGATGDTAITDSSGRVRFRVSSNIVSVTPSTITARVDGLSLSTRLTFVPATDLIAYRLDVTVPFQSRDYDNEVLVHLKIKGSDLDNDVAVSGYYLKTPETLGNKLTELNAATIYLKPNATYTMWAKGRYHLARLSGDIITGGSAPAQAITIDLTRNLGIPPTPTGLLIGDLLPNTRQVSGVSLALPYHDNAVNTIDVSPIYAAWFKTADIPDFLRDFVVNVADWLYWFNNYGNGELGGPPPYNQRL